MLKNLAEKVAKEYALHPNVEAVMIGGSVSRGLEDAHSDIELFVLWKEGPTDDDRRSVIERLNGDIITYFPYEDEEWSESYLTEGIKLEMSHFLTRTIENVIHAVVENGDIAYDKQCLVASIHDGIPLYGDTLIKDLKKNVEHYPEKLSQSMILENLELGGLWNNRKAFLDRQDWLIFYKMLTNAQASLMGVLYGLNQIYVQHPSFKWQRATLAQMDIKPDNVAERLEKILLSSPTNSLVELENLFQETVHLIQRHFPDLTLDDQLEQLAFVRPIHEI